MGMTFTESEIERKQELRDQIAANPTSPEVSAWQAELQSIVSAAHTRMRQRAEQRRAKAEEKAEEAVELVSERDLYTEEEKSDESEIRQRMRELRAEIDAATRKKKKAELEAEYHSLLTESIDRFKRAERRAIKSGKCLSMPEHETYHSDEDFEEAMEWHRLNLAEAACYRKLNSPKTSFNLRRDVEKELVRITDRRRKLRPEDYETESSAPNSEAPDLDDSHEEITKSKDASLMDCSDLSDFALRESFSKQKFFRDQLGFTDNGPLIASLETEMRRRGMQF